MYSRTDLLIEALAAGTAAVVSAVVADRVQIGRRTLESLGRGPAPSRSTVLRMMTRARLVEAALVMLVFRGTLGGARRVLRELAVRSGPGSASVSPPPGWRAIRERPASPRSAGAT